MHRVLCSMLIAAPLLSQAQAPAPNEKFPSYKAVRIRAPSNSHHGYGRQTRFFLPSHAQFRSSAREPLTNHILVSTEHRGGNPAGGGSIYAINRNDLPTNPSALQLAMAINPPGLQTRINSSATRSGRGADIAPNMVSTTSNS